LCIQDEDAILSKLEASSVVANSGSEAVSADVYFVDRFYPQFSTWFITIFLFSLFSCFCHC